MKKQNPQSSSEPSGRLSALRERLRPFCMPAVGVLAVCAAVLSFIFLWPRPQNEEEAATLPGAGGEPAQQEDAPQAAQTGSETPEHEESITHRFWETVPEMSLEEAVAIAKEKLDRPNDPLTDRERMAIYTWMISAFETYENWDLARHQKVLALVGAEFEEGYGPDYYDPDGYEFSVRIATDPAYDGANIFEQFPWKNENFREYSLVNTSNRFNHTENFTMPLRVFDRELSDLTDDVMPYYRTIQFHAVDSFQFHVYRDREIVDPPRVPDEMFREMLRHYLSLEPVTFADLSFHTWAEPE